MNKNTSRIAFVALAFIVFSLSTRAEDSNSASVMALALQMMQKYPGVCLGMESVPGLNETISGKEAISDARENWSAFGTVMAAQTDYTLEVVGNNVLIAPKIAPKLHDGPVVKRPISLDVAVSKWKTIGDALSGISFKDKAQKFAPSLLVTSMTRSAEQGLQTEVGVVEAIKSGVLGEKSEKTIDLADALFLIARLSGASTWSYQSTDGIQIAGKPSVGSRKLTEGNLSFAGSLN